MPGLFSSWKPRFRGRKTSDSERSSSSISSFFPSSSSKHLSKRAVHFNDNGLGSNRDGPLNTTDWKYADEVAAPLASSEPLDEPKEQPQTNGTKISGSQQQSPTNDDSNGAASDGETEQTGTLLRTSRLPGSLAMDFKSDEESPDDFEK